MDDHWTLEKEMQELIDGLQYLDPGDEDYDKRLRALKEVNAMIPKISAKDEIDAKRAETEAKRAEIEAKKADIEVRKTEIEANRAETEARKADIEARKAEMEMQREADGNRIHWPKVIETGIPIVAGILVTGLMEACGLIFTSKGTFFWRK